ncbi:ATP-binding protein, partial [Kaarinaea lacus]
ELAVSEMMLGEMKYTGVVRDVTARKRADRILHETMATKQAILDSANFSIISTDTTGLIKTFNAGAQRMLGYSEEEMINRRTPEIFHDKDEVVAYASELSNELGYEIKPGYETFTARAKLGKADEHEWTYIRKDGRRIPVLLSVTPIRDNMSNLSGYLGIAVDITEQKANDKMKDEFISTVSHELRTPLTSIRGSLGLINGGATGEFSGSLRSLLNIAYKNTDRLLMLINDILDINKIESGNMSFRYKPINTSAFLQHALEVNEGYAKQEKVHFIITEMTRDAYIYADEDRLMQVMSNLLSNAAKFSPESSDIKISSSRIGNTLRISVADSGPGIPENFQHKVFDKFTQQDSSDTRKVGGTGLGLSITKAIIDKHNGRIGFATTPGIGTVFYFDLPVLENTGLDISLSNLNPLNRSVHPVLITEDDPHIASLLKLILTQAGFDADIALTAESAREMLHTRQYDAMTLDLMLPDKNGIDFFHDIRNDPVTCNLPVIIISAVASETRNRLQDHNLDVVDWLEKPVDETKLINCLNAIFVRETRRPAILHVENDVDMVQLIDTLFSDIADITHAKNLQEAVQYLDNQSFDVALLEIELADGSGLELLKHERVITDNTQVIIFTDHAPMSESADKLRKVLLKSQTSPEELISVLRASLKTN